MTGTIISRSGRCIIGIVLLATAILAGSCGYYIVGSRFLPFQSITIKAVDNKTYEPGLEERLHRALSREFIRQGIEVKVRGGEAELEAVVTTFALGAIGAVDDTIKEQEVLMEVDVRMLVEERVTRISGLRSPIKITFQSTGTVSESVAHKEDAVDKACREIAREVVSRLLIIHAK